jgi:cobalt/nickel transport system ATP-binding protein
MTAAIEVTDLGYTYPDGTTALAGVNFSLAPGECVGLVGPSGAGKSTLALCLVGSIFAQTGGVKVGGIELTKKTVRAARKKIGLIFQDPDNQLFMPTLSDDVAFGLRQAGWPEDEVADKVAQALADRGLAGLERKFPGHLSGGQKRLAALAGVLVMEPEVLLLDEPSSNLDPRARRGLINQLHQLPNTRLIASHDLEMILDLCGRVILIDQGRIISDGDPETILGNAELMAAHGLEVPHSLLPHRHEHTPHRRKEGGPA